MTTQDKSTEKSVQKTITIPAPLQQRLKKYDENASGWMKLNVSAICAEALDKRLTDMGY